MDNTRLDKEYNLIAESNKQRFLDNKLNTDEMWGKSVWGITFQIKLSTEVNNYIDGIQKKLEDLESGNLLFPDRNSRHISFQQVIFWNGKYSKSKKQIWKDMGKSLLKKLPELDNKYVSFRIAFKKLIPTQGGIIFVADDPLDYMQGLRSEFVQQIDVPGETKKFNKIIHTTIARYKNVLVNPKRVYDFLITQEVNIEMKVDKITLEKELIFPSKKVETISTLSLL